MKINSKGFTLVELIAVIVIISLLTILVLPRIMNSINNSQDKVDDALKEIIFSASQIYVSNHSYDYPKVNENTYEITLMSLINDGLLNSPVKTALGTDITNTKCVQVTYEDDYLYSLIDCTN